LGNLANASSVGAKTVNGPLPFSVSTKPAAVTAAANVLKLPAETAVSTMSFSAEALELAVEQAEHSPAWLAEKANRFIAKANDSPNTKLFMFLLPNLMEIVSIVLACDTLPLAYQAIRRAGATGFENRGFILAED
jgi:hypothetical protein